jgi:hypothetical protein
LQTDHVLGVEAKKPAICELSAISCPQAVVFFRAVGIVGGFGDFARFLGRIANPDVPGGKHENTQLEESHGAT